MHSDRRAVCLCFLSLFGCTSPAPALTEPPALIHGGWSREAFSEITAAELPASIRSVRAEKIWRARYRGPRDIDSIWVRYPNETAAFDAFQRFSKTPAIRLYRRGSYLVLLDTEGVPPQKLGDFEEGISKAIS
jgi:hypothetical protein